MSADNYVIVKKFDDGWRWHMGFASDERDVCTLTRADFRRGPFKTSQEACEDATDECYIIEYGIEVIAAPCDWTWDDVSCKFDTECGNAFQFIDGEPSDNGFKYCPYCGSDIKVLIA